MKQLLFFLKQFYNGLTQIFFNIITNAYSPFSISLLWFRNFNFYKFFYFFTFFTIFILIDFFRTITFEINKLHE